MRIAILSEVYPSPQKPDQRAFVHARARLYQANGHEVCVFCQPEEVAQDGYFVEGVEVVCGGVEKLLRSIEAFGPEVIAFHTPYPGTDVFEVARLLVGRFAVVTWIHGYEAMMTALYGYHQGWSLALSIPWDMRKLWHLRRFLGQCQAVVYVSRWLRRVAERGMFYRHPQTEVIHNPVDLALFRPKESEARTKGEDKMRGIALRSLGPKYGLDLAVRAYGSLSADGHKEAELGACTDLTIVGTGPLEGSLRQLIAETKSATQLVAQGVPHTAVPELLRGYDYFVAPSRNETQGLAMCEAMACGLPVVATCVGGIPEFVRDGVDGYLVPPEDPVRLREAIGKLVSDPQRLREMGRNARANMEQECDGVVVAERELAVLAEASKRQGVKL